jgi:peptidoglycan hydrolase CwlO-like protein
MIISILITLFIILIVYQFLYYREREGMTDTTSTTTTSTTNTTTTDLSQQNTNNIKYLQDNTQTLLKKSYDINNTKTELQSNINSLQQQITNFVSDQTNKLPSSPPVITGAVAIQ